MQKGKSTPSWVRKYGVYTILLVLLALAWAWIRWGSNAGYDLKPDHFQVKKPELISGIFIAERNGKTVHLERMPDNNSWTVNGRFPADPDALNGLMEILTQVQIKYPVPESQKESVLAQMATGSIKVELYMGKKKKTWYVGPTTQDMTGTYWMEEGSDDPQITHLPGFNGFLTVRFSAHELDWRDRTLFAVPANQIEWIKVNYPNDPKKSFHLEVIDDQYIRLSNLNGDTASGEVDGGFLRSYLDAFGRIKLESIETEIPPGKADSIKASTPLASISIKSRGQKQEQKVLFYSISSPVRGSTFIPEGQADPSDPERCLAYTPDLEFGMAQFRVIGPLLVTYSNFIASSNNVF